MKQQKEVLIDDQFCMGRENLMLVYLLGLDMVDLNGFKVSLMLVHQLFGPNELHSPAWWLRTIRNIRQSFWMTLES